MTLLSPQLSHELDFAPFLYFVPLLNFIFSLILFRFKFTGFGVSPKFPLPEDAEETKIVCAREENGRVSVDSLG